MTLLAFLSDRCNMTCSYCFLSLNRGRASVLSADELLPAMEGHPKVSLLGGEPALHWDLVRAAARPGVTLVTNGTLLDAQRLSELRSKGADLCVSLDGDAAANDAGRRLLAGGSAHEAVLSAVTDRSWARVNLVLTPATAGRLLQSLEHLRGLGFRRFSFHPDVMGAWDESAVGALRAALGGLARYKAALGDRIEVAHAAAYARECSGDTGEVILGADGNYYPGDGLFSRPYAELGRFACGSARSGLDDGALARWNEEATRLIHGWIGAEHRTCPREPYFRALAEGGDAREACRAYARADAAVGEALCALA